MAGETVTFKVTNTAGFDHNFYLGPADALSANNPKPDLPGIPTFSSGTKEVTYTFESTDPLQFACTLPGHYGSMHGDFAFVK